MNKIVFKLEDKKDEFVVTSYIGEEENTIIYPLTLSGWADAYKKTIDLTDDCIGKNKRIWATTPNSVNGTNHLVFTSLYNDTIDKVYLFKQPLYFSKSDYNRNTGDYNKKPLPVVEVEVEVDTSDEYKEPNNNYRKIGPDGNYFLLIMVIGDNITLRESLGDYNNFINFQHIKEINKIIRFRDSFEIVVEKIEV